MADIDIPFASGDTAPTVRKTLRDGNGNAVDLTGATVTFLYSKVVTTDESSPQQSIGCVLFDAANGVVDFNWPGEAAPRGEKLFFTGQYKAVFGNGKVMHFPNAVPLLSVCVVGEP